MTVVAEAAVTVVAEAAVREACCSIEGSGADLNCGLRNGAGIRSPSSHKQQHHPQDPHAGSLPAFKASLSTHLALPIVAE